MMLFPACFLLCGDTYAQVQQIELMTEFVNGNRITVDDKINYEFDIERNATVTHQLRFKNIGGQPLVIENMYSTLNSPFGRVNIIAIKWPEKPVQPGKKASIFITYSSGGLIGSFDGNVFLSCNASGAGVVLLHVSGDVRMLTEEVANKYRRREARLNAMNSVFNTLIEVIGRLLIGR